MKLRDLAVMAPDKKREAIAGMALVAAGGHGTYVAERLAGFEAQYSMTTAEMILAFEAGQLRDTPDIAQWLVFSRAR